MELWKLLVFDGFGIGINSFRIFRSSGTMKRAKKHRISIKYYINEIICLNMLQAVISSKWKLVPMHEMMFHNFWIKTKWVEILWTKLWRILYLSWHFNLGLKFEFWVRFKYVLLKQHVDDCLLWHDSIYIVSPSWTMEFSDDFVWYQVSIRDFLGFMLDK